MAASDPKAAERAYYARLGPEGLAHVRRKPFGDERTGQYLADMGALLAMLEPPPRSVLDLGCGVGWTSRLLARAGYAVTGMDLAPESIQLGRELAAQEGLTDLQLLVGDYETAGPAGGFDYVLFYDALHHAADEAAALKTAWTALRSGGAMFAFEPGSGHNRSRLSRRAVEEFGVRERDMPPQRIWRLGRKVGFRRRLILPLPHDINRSLYRRDYHASSAAGRGWLEKLWGYYRAAGWMLRPRRGALTILWK
ncbi:MAG: class I SAM-dependent methyltransferase [Opitutaceae bacterium]|nr:class I SAM-dependent methyltransferase [Opitutaceae bacterium]